MKKVDLIIVLSLAILFLASCVDAQRTSRISRPCPGSTTPASVEVDREGDVNVTPCPGREFGITAPTLKVYDPTYSGFIFTPTLTRFSVASTTAQIVPAATNFVGVDFNSTANMSATNSMRVVGLANHYGATGSGTAVRAYGIFSQFKESTGFSGSYQWIYGFSNRVTPNEGSLTGDLRGVDITAGSGGFAFTTDSTNTDIHALYANTVHGYAVTANRVVGVRAGTQGANAPNPGSSVAHLIGLDVRHWGLSGTAANNTVANRYGVYVGNYSTNNYVVTNNYGIYLDSTIDELGASKFAIYSQATSTSRFFGKLDFDATYTAVGTTGNQTINKPAFSVNFAAAATSLTVTNSFVTSSASVLICMVQTNDSTMKSVAAVAGSGSVVLHANAAATGETKVYCEVKN